MSTQWITEFVDQTADSGLNIRMAIEPAGNIHLVYVVGNQLNHRIGTPAGLTLIFTGGFLSAHQTYQWAHHDNVLPSLEWDATSQFDLAVDSRGTAHLCFQGIDATDHMTLGDVQHAIWDGSAFAADDVLPASAASISLSGIAMTIANDDSVHIAFSGGTKLQHATRASNSTSFQLEDVDTRSGGFSYLSIAVGSGGQIGISYIFGPHTNAQLVFAEKTPAGWILETAVPAPLNFGQNAWAAGLGLPGAGTNSLVIASNGAPHIAFFNDGPGGLGIRHATRRTKGRISFWALGGLGELVDPKGLPSAAKILLDKNNGLHIAYQASPQGQAGTTSQLMFAVRTVAGWITATADGSPKSGWSVSAAMDPKTGEPHIGYGAEFQGVGAFQLKHAWAVDLTRIPFPPHHTKRPILVRPDRG
jgi:hypothetical protein